MFGRATGGAPDVRWLVLLLVLCSFGLLVAALVTTRTGWAWGSVAASGAAAGLLVADWLGRRRDPAHPLTVVADSPPNTYRADDAPWPEAAPLVWPSPDSQADTLRSDTPVDLPSGAPEEPPTDAATGTSAAISASPRASGQPTISVLSSVTSAESPPPEPAVAERSDGTEPLPTPELSDLPAAVDAGRPAGTRRRLIPPPAPPVRPLRRSVEQTVPAGSVDPTDPTDPTEPTEPADQGGPADQAESVVPDESVALDERDSDEPVDPAAEPAQERADIADAIAVSDLDDDVVVLDERPRYHLRDCRWVGERATQTLPVREARQLGFTPCAGCAPDAALAARHRAPRR